MDDISNYINQRLVKYRKLAGLTQSEVADYLGIKRTTYSHMERYGNFHCDTLKKLCDLYKVSPDAILLEDESESLFKPIPETVYTFNDHNIFKNSDILPLSLMEANVIRILRNLPKEKANHYIKELNELYHQQKNKK